VGETPTAPKFYINEKKKYLQVMYRRKIKRNQGKFSIHDNKLSTVYISFHPMLKHGDFMNKTRSPYFESWSDEFEDPSISLFPDTPASNGDHFRETWAQKRSLGIPKP
jgi:hypothetical protein